jgi:hypothetical protein
MGYCSVEDIRYMMQLPTPYDDESQPTATYVQTMIDNISSRIDIQLKSTGFNVPLTNADQLRVVKQYTIYGVVGDLDNFSKNATVLSVRGQEYQKRFIDFLNDISGHLNYEHVEIYSYGQGKEGGYLDIDEVVK